MAKTRTRNAPTDENPSPTRAVERDAAPKARRLEYSNQGLRLVRRVLAPLTLSVFRRTV